MKNSVKKKLLFLSTLLILTTCHSTDFESPCQEVVSSTVDNYINYSNGRIFIGDKEYLDSIEEKLDTDIFVLDLRNESDPNFKIFDSYLINDADVINEVLEALCEYERLHPSKWNRTIESMRMEWIIHNISYYYNYKRNRTTDVDLNNNDEELYDNIILRKVLEM